MADDIKTLFGKWVNKFRTQNNDPTKDSPDNLPDSEFNGTDQYKLSNADYQNLEDIKEGNFQGISIDELFSVADKIEHVNNQRAGILRTSGNTTRTAEFNISRQYNKDNGDLEFLANTDIERNEENINNVVGNASGSLDKTFKLNDNIAYLADQQAGILKTSDGTTKTADFTSITIYEGGYLTDLNSQSEADNNTQDKNAIHASEQRDGILRSNTETRISEFNSGDAYPSLKNEDGSFVDRDTEKQRVDLLNNWNSNERPSLSRGNTYGNSIQYQRLSNPYEKIEINLGTLFEGAGTIEVYDNNISKRFLQKLTNTATNGFNSYDSFKNFDDFFNQVDEVTASGIFVGDDNDIKDTLRRWIENFDNLSSSDLTSDRVGGNPYVNDTNNRESFFSNTTPYNSEDTYYADRYRYRSDTTTTVLRNNFSRNSHLNETDIRDANRVATGNQLGSTISVRVDNSTKSVTQFFNIEQQYDINSPTVGYRNRILFTDNDSILDIARKKRVEIDTILKKWNDNAQDILGGRRTPTEDGNDHYINNKTLSPESNISSDNVFSGTDYGPLDYMLLFYESIDEWTSSPSVEQQRDMAKKGFNVGQILGSGYFKQRTNESLNKEDIPTDILNLLGNIAGFSGGFDNNGQDISNRLEIAKQEIVDSYIPGFNRPPQTIRIAAPLENYLNQNLLTTDLNSVNSVFDKLYLINPSAQYAQQFAVDAGNAIVDPTVFEEGVLGGVPLVEIQKDGRRKDGGVLRKVFDFANDPTYEQKINGFNNNIPGSVKRGFVGSGFTENQSDVGNELPAVVNQPRRQFLDSLANRQQKGDEQYFPFLFETENRTSNSSESFEQMCYLQATLDNINESYNPAWQQKHFFGRTEQISTYTYTDRVLDLSFSVVANTIRQLQNLHERVSWLAQQTYGQYNINAVGQVSKLGAGPLIKMTIGDMFVGLGGYIQSLSYDWNFLGAGGKWEITEGLRIPMGCKVSMSFKVLHDDLPDRNYALYSGPLQRADGLIRPAARFSGDKTTEPLIPVTDAETYVDLLANNTSVGNNLGVIQ